MELEVVRKLIERLNNEDVCYCHWKSNQHIGDMFTGKDDIDMLIDVEDVPKLNVILSELDFKRFRLPEKRSYIGIDDFLGYDGKQGKFVHLHLHYKLTLGEKFLKGYQIPQARAVLSRRIFNEDFDIFTSSHEDEMWLLLVRLAMKIRLRDNIKMMVGKDVFGRSVHNEYDWLRERIDVNRFQGLATKYLGPDVATAMLSTVNDNLSFRKICRLRKQILESYRPFRTYSRPVGTLMGWSRELFRVRQEIHNRVYRTPTLFRRSPATGGQIIAFIGPDGAGKSTIMSDVMASLKPIMDISQFYLGSGDGGSSVLRKPIRLLYKLLLRTGTLNRKGKKINQHGEVYWTDERGSLIRSLGTVPWTLTLARERRKKLLKASVYRNRGYVVLTDRYPQTQVTGFCDGPRYYLNPTNDGGFIRDLLVRSEKKCFEIANTICPDVVIILNVAPEVAHQRKPSEVDIDTHQRMMEAILGLRFGENTKQIVVDANQSYEKVLLDVLKSIWRQI